MPDLSALLLRKSVGSLRSNREGCARCHRAPLAGERLHEMESGRTLCELCLIALPEEKRKTIGVRRVHASDQRLTVAPKAA
jgi:hypothetical protein